MHSDPLRNVNHPLPKPIHNFTLSYAQLQKYFDISQVQRSTNSTYPSFKLLKRSLLSRHHFNNVINYYPLGLILESKIFYFSVYIYCAYLFFRLNKGKNCGKTLTNYPY